MYREIYQITDNPWDTEDVIQMVWVKLLDKVSLLRSRDTTRLVNYIIAACRNTAITYRQQKKRLAEYTYSDEKAAPSEALTAHDPIWEPEERFLALRQAWSQLDPRSQYVLRSRFLLNKTFEEMAQELGIQPKSVRMAVTRAKRKAKALILQALEHACAMLPLISCLAMRASKEMEELKSFTVSSTSLENLPAQSFISYFPSLLASSCAFTLMGRPNRLINPAASAWL